MANGFRGCGAADWLRRQRGALVWAMAMAVAAAHAADSQQPYPLEQWAMRAVVSNVELSPDGKHLALMQIPSRDGDPIIEVYDAANLAEKPFRLNADPMEIIGFQWMNDKKLLFTARKRVRDQVRREESPYGYKIGLLDLESKDVQDFSADGGVGIPQLLPRSPDKVILSIGTPSRSRMSERARRLQGAVTPRDYYELDLNKGTRRLLVQGKYAFGGYRFDANGRLWYAQGSDIPAREARWMWRPPEDEEWVEFHRQGWDDYEFDPFYVMELDDMNANHAYVLARNGHDTIGLWSYDLKNKRFAEEIFRHPRVDVDPRWTPTLIYHSNTWEHPDTVVGVLYVTDKMHKHFFDEAEEALHRQLESIIPAAHDVYIVSRSRDGATLVAYNRGPRDPGTYYLLKSGKLEPIGSAQPLFASESLADTEFVSYQTRDGLDMFAYLTTPNGEPPFPLVVLPHGGPQARDRGGYDKWAQLLANYGYMVIQPQFRGSNGFGRALREAAFEDGGQEGRKMQDDNDDAALHLVKRGLADKDRMAMFGWSYGGYAAAVAASRTPQLYQCVVAGAAVFDPVLQWRYDRRGVDGKMLERYVAYEEAGVDPIDEVAKVNVPMLVVHGVVDPRVLIDHATTYVNLLEEHDKPHKYVKLEGAGHSTLLYEHQVEFFTAMIDFLANDCGPGGL